MSLQRLILTFVFCASIVTINHQVEGMLTAKIRRTQSLRPRTIQRAENLLNVNTQSGSLSSISSFASTSTLSELQAAESQPIASASSRKQIDSARFKNVDLHPLAEKTKHVSFINSVNLDEASASTYSDGHIDPSRDGVFARVRNTLLRYGSAAALGTAIGAGGVVIDQHFFHNNNISETFTTKTTSERSVDDEITNPL